jgi:hypothetical protein
MTSSTRDQNKELYSGNPWTDEPTTQATAGNKRGECFSFVKNVIYPSGQQCISSHV